MTNESLGGAVRRARRNETLHEARVQPRLDIRQHFALLPLRICGVHCGVRPCAAVMPRSHRMRVLPPRGRAVPATGGHRGRGARIAETMAAGARRAA
eukprot:5888052-Pyramimonas_sp.AAC.1